MAVQFHMLHPIKLKNPALIEGFPGLGLVGTISASYLVDKLKMDFVGYITSDQFPPLAAIHGHKPMFPARIYASKKHNLIVLLAEFIVPLSAIYELSAKIHEFARANNVRQIVSLGGIAMKGEVSKVYAIASSEKLLGELERHHQVQLIKEGATTGVTAVLLAQGAVEDFPVVSFLAQAHEEYMDPNASATVLEVLKSYLKLDFDTGALKEEAAELEVKMKDILSKARASHQQYKKTADLAGPNLGPMYG